MKMKLKRGGMLVHMLVEEEDVEEEEVEDKKQIMKVNVRLS